MQNYQWFVIIQFLLIIYLKVTYTNPDVKKEDPEKPEYRQLAEEALKEYLKRIGDLRYHIIKKINRVTTQNLAGTITRIDFDIIPTDCKLNENMEPVSNACPIIDLTDIINCKSDIWNHQWGSGKDINTVCVRNFTV